MAEVGLKVALYQFYQSAFYLFGFMCLPVRAKTYSAVKKCLIDPDSVFFCIFCRTYSALNKF